MKKKLLTGMIFSAAMSYGQVGINTPQPHPSSDLTLASENKGLLLNRVILKNTTNAAPLAGHVAGMVVYNTVTDGDVTPGEYYNDGSKWVRTEALESWLAAGTMVKASESTQNIYRIGKVGIGDFSSSNEILVASLQVKGAIRGGEYDRNEIPGKNSIAVGSAGNSAKGDSGAAFGFGNSAGGDYSLAAGYGNYSSNIATVALGQSNRVNSQFSVAIGSNHTIGKTVLGGSVAIGTQNTVNHDNSIVLGGHGTSTKSEQLVFSSFIGGIRFQDKVTSSTNSGNGIREYADNAAALAAGLESGTLYRTGDVLKIVHQ
ncbi:hypothetical protein [Chryseobacterium jejuense]|uniref:hypothetical protein n=1 Tax=Chryseobacterium jejuense TaxID=445960 RepID=UPI001AE70DCC|nr:hypothetical protein [Chryseobacterium jejuense]MBP2618854.1 hypothetical protein [Chryseobacterium jejuense]